MKQKEIGHVKLLAEERKNGLCLNCEEKVIFLLNVNHISKDHLLER